MSTLKTMTVADLAARLKSAPVPSPVAAAREGLAQQELRAATALIDQFQSGDLVFAQESAVAAFVVADCDRVRTSAGGAWRLRDEVRRDTLATLARTGRWEAATRIEPRHDDFAGRMARNWVRNDHNWSKLGYHPNQLAAALRVVGWLTGLVPGLPEKDELADALQLATVVQPLRVVTARRVVGRQSEVDRLRHFVNSRNTDKAPIPFAIDGPGGVGKSTVLAKVLLGPGGRLRTSTTVTYLTFDRDDLRPGRVLGLLVETAIQVRSQIRRDDRFMVDDLVGEARQAEDFELRREREYGSRLSGSMASNKRSRYDAELLIRRFASVLQSTLPNQRLVWVFDTFERAQQYPWPDQNRFLDTLEKLRRQLPGLRILIAGRAPVVGYKTRRLALTGLPLPAALELLRSLLGPGKWDERLLHSVVERVSGNPLSLRLAADFLRGHPRLVHSPRDRSRLLDLLSRDQVQGMLYRRILDRITNPRVRALANPGLVLRRVTPDLIREVLAPGCGLGQVSLAEAHQLFESLGRDLSLVEPASDGALIHRADVRALTLPLLQAADPRQYRALQLAAVGYYLRQVGTTARTEELYHRLLLGQSAEQLDLRWEPVAGAALAPALPELPLKSRAYVQLRLDLTSSEVELAATDDLTWSAQVVREANRLLAAGLPNEALHLLSARGLAQPDLSVIALRAQVLATLADHQKALALVAGGLESGPQSGRTELITVGARIAEDAGQWDLALRYFLLGREQAKRDGDHMVALSSGVGALRVHRRSGGTVTFDPAQMRGEVEREADSLSSRERAQNPSVMRDLAAEFGAERRDYLATAIRTGGIDVLGDEDKDKIRDVVGAEGYQRLAEVASGSTTGEYVDPSSFEQAENVSASLASDDQVAASVYELYQSESDGPSYDYRQE